MSKSTARVTAMPTALVASLGQAASSGRRRGGGLKSISLPNPMDRLTASRRRRHRRQRLMKVARNAGAVVSAVTFAAEMASALRDIKGAGQDSSPSRSTGNRSAAGAKKAHGQSSAKRAQGSASKTQGPAKRAQGPAKKTQGTAKKAQGTSKRSATAANKTQGSTARRADAGANGNGNGNGNRSRNGNGRVGANANGSARSGAGRG